ncbi:MAG: hypothetical protein AAB726_02020 [Patescibacteria group bacterium]
MLCFRHTHDPGALVDSVGGNHGKLFCEPPEVGFLAATMVAVVLGLVNLGLHLYANTIATYSEAEYDAATSEELVNLGYLPERSHYPWDKPRFYRFDLPGNNQFCLIDIVRESEVRMTDNYNIVPERLGHRLLPTQFERIMCPELFSGGRLWTRPWEHGYVPERGFHTTMMASIIMFLGFRLSKNEKLRLLSRNGVAIALVTAVLSIIIVEAIAYLLRSAPIG